MTRSQPMHYCLLDWRVMSTDVSLRIDDAYIAANVPVVKEQLAKAGIRLAHTLDQALSAALR